MALNNLAVLLHQRGDLEGAELYLLRAVVLGREPSDALVNLSAISQAEQNSVRWLVARVPIILADDLLLHAPTEKTP